MGDFMIKILVVHKENGFIWNFINVYGAAQNDQKQKFLSELSSFCSKCNHPMLVGGDFNILRKETDKNKPRGTNNWSSLFNSIIDFHNLIELDLNGRLYTWSNNRDPPFLKSWTGFLLVQNGTFITEMLVFLDSAGHFLIMFPCVSEMTFCPH
jgi:exonuclease III